MPAQYVMYSKVTSGDTDDFNIALKWLSSNTAKEFDGAIYMKLTDATIEALKSVQKHKEKTSA